MTRMLDDAIRERAHTLAGVTHERDAACADGVVTQQDGRIA
ncbi:hypothetical protein [Pseudonocardia cypriaca]|uniref:Uncharacterized protein n=1 Tax=Pseudonocardia cypriaca TaxID=882449 RepID=A0A543GBK2_9PSEU|nr:hypothetical protein [Pseudonocardia cypriaca]TQM43449.1 hypothetical protein FB388_0795 [Pseudonocardia cypriaca]